MKNESQTSGPRIRADFNGLFGDLLCISHEDTCQTLDGKTLSLKAGMRLTATDDDVDDAGKPDNLLATGVIEASPAWLQCQGSRWVLRIDSRGVVHESDLP